MTWNLLSKRTEQLMHGMELRTLMSLLALLLWLPMAVQAADLPPTIATAAAATPAIVIGKTTKLTIVGADDGGAAQLIYGWAATGPAAVTFSATGTNAAKTVTATFSAIGDYQCTATVRDAGGQTVTSTVAVNVASTVATLSISPTTAVLNPTATRTFIATLKNQFGTLLTTVTPTWTATGNGTVDATGLFTADQPGAATVTVAAGAKTATASIRVNAAPTVAMAAATATPTVVGITAALSVQGADDDNVDFLTYTWSATGPKAVTFAPRSSVLGEQTTATFHAVGDYLVTVVISDKQGLTATSSTTMTVLPTATSAAIAPTTAVLNPAAVKAFTAMVKDQFGAVFVMPPAVLWTAMGGIIDATGHFTAGTVAGAASATVTVADQASVTGTASIRVNAAPTVAMAAATATPTVVGITAALTVQGADDDNVDFLTYTWSATGPKAVTFAPRSSVLGEQTTATFHAVGDYLVTVVISDKQGLTATSSTTMTVLPTATSIAISPTTAVLNPTAARAFTATVKDQFGALFVMPPTMLWTALGGSIDGTGHFTAGTVAGAASATVTVADQASVAATAAIRINAAPTIATAAQVVEATPMIAVPLHLTVLGADDAGEASLTYTWSVAAGGTTGVVFSGATQKTHAAQALMVTVSRAGSYVFKATIRDAQGLTVTSSVSVVVSALITPVISWAAPAPITYGTVLGVAQLQATTTVAGVFVYTPVEGTLLTAGTHTLSALFTPTDAAHYTTATASVSLTVQPATPVITWATPVAMSYGMALTATQLAAVASVPGMLTYTPALGSVPEVGTQTLTVVFVPADAVDYVTVTQQVPLAVNPVTPAITWADPASLTPGIELSTVQLSATASEAGSFTYEPPLGTWFNVGSVVLTATFVPADPVHVSTISAQRTLLVQRSPQSPTVAYFTIDPQASLGVPCTLGAVVTDDGPLDALTYTWSVLDGPSASAIAGVVISGAGQGTTAAQSMLVTFTEVGIYRIEVQVMDADGMRGTGELWFTIEVPSSDIRWMTDAGHGNPIEMAYGTQASDLFSATATTPGVFTYSVPYGSILPVGESPLRVTFTPLDPAFPVTTATIWVHVSFPDNLVTPYVSFMLNFQPQVGRAVYFAYDLSLSVYFPGAVDQQSPYWIEYATEDGLELRAEEQEIAVVIHPYDEATYATVRASVWIDLRPLATVTWNPPASVAYGTDLSALFAMATASEPGTFLYYPSPDTILEVGDALLSVQFAPTDATRAYTNAQVVLHVHRIEPLITVASIHHIWGETPTDADLVVTTSQPGVVQLPALLGWPFQAGAQIIQAAFIPTDAAHVAAIAVPVTVIFERAVPVVGWPQPWSLSEGTALGADQLAAVAMQSGSFAYSPAAGAVLGVGTHVLQALFTPTDSAHFTSVTISVALTIVPATQVLPGQTTTFAYDHVNQMTARSYRTAADDTFAYDRTGHLLRAASGRSQTTVERVYDAVGRMTEDHLTIDNDELSVRCAYDALGRLISQTYPDGSLVQRDYTARNQLAHVWDLGQAIATRTYDAGGRLITTQYGNGLSEARTYAVGETQVATIRVPGVTDFTYGYDANKRKTAEIDGITATNTQQFAYDAADRVTNWQRTVGATGPVQAQQAWSLSPVGDWTATTTDGVTQNRTHTPVHEIASIGNTPILSDFKGNLTQDEQGQQYTWDVENRLASASNLQQGHGDAATYVYDALGRRVKKTVTTHIPAVGDVPAHDLVVPTYFISVGAQEVIEITGDLSAFNDAAADSEGAGIAPLDPVSGGGARGSLLADPHATRINFQPSATDTPDGWGKDVGTAPAWLTDVTPVNRDHLGRPLYDTFAPIGTSAWRMPVANGTHAVVIMCGDADSRAQTNHLLVNGVAVTDLTPYDGSMTHGYETGSFDGYAVTVTVTDGAITITGGVDALDPKINFIEVGAVGSVVDQATSDRVAAAAIQATHDTARARAKTPPLVKRNVWGTYVDESLSMTVQKPRHAAIRYFAHSNHLYSIASTTNATGTVVERYTYTAYGQRFVTSSAGVTLVESAVNQNCGFTGYKLDSEDGLYYARSRMYAARLGRFVGRDPNEYIDGYSMYCGYFVPNATDPTGEWAVSDPLILNGSGGKVEMMSKEVRDRIEGSFFKALIKASKLAGEADKLASKLTLAQAANKGCVNYACLIKNLIASRDMLRNVIDGLQSNDLLQVHVDSPAVSGVVNAVNGEDIDAYVLWGSILHYAPSGWGKTAAEFDELTFHELTHIDRSLHPGLSTDDGQSKNPWRQAAFWETMSSIENWAVYKNWKVAAEGKILPGSDLKFYTCTTAGLPMEYSK